MNSNFGSLVKYCKNSAWNVFGKLSESSLINELDAILEKLYKGQISPNKTLFLCHIHALKSAVICRQGEMGINLISKHLKVSQLAEEIFHWKDNKDNYVNFIEKPSAINKGIDFPEVKYISEKYSMYKNQLLNKEGFTKALDDYFKSINAKINDIVFKLLVVSNSHSESLLKLIFESLEAMNEYLYLKKS